METTAKELCSDGKTIVDVEYYPFPCGDGTKVVYKRLTTINPRKGVNPARCRWNTRDALRKPGFSGSFLGSCGVAPQHGSLKHLPMRYCSNAKGVEPVPPPAPPKEPVVAPKTGLDQCDKQTEYLDNVDMHGDDLVKGFATTDKKACCKACLDHEACNFWTWGTGHPKGKHCWLKRNNRSMQRQANRVSGTITRS
jgi:hypothetical protein